jgi:hypothetical protein
MKPLSKAVLSPAKLALWTLPGALVLTGGYLLVASGRGHLAVNPPAASASVGRLSQAADAPALPVEAPVSAPAREGPRISASPSGSPSSLPLSPRNPRLHARARIWLASLPRSTAQQNRFRQEAAQAR